MSSFMVANNKYDSGFQENIVHKGKGEDLVTGQRIQNGKE